MFFFSVIVKGIVSNTLKTAVIFQLQPRFFSFLLDSLPVISSSSDVGETHLRLFIQNVVVESNVLTYELQRCDFF